MLDPRTQEKFRIRLRRAVLMLVGLLALAPNVPASPAGDAHTQPLVIETANGQVHYRVELAADSESRRTGLMYRESLPADRGMLFDFHRSKLVQMWMKDTRIPLDILFIDNSGRIMRIAEHTEPKSTAFIESGGPARAVLELNAGSAARQGIRVGDRVRHAIFKD